MSDKLFLDDTITTPEGEIEGRFMLEFPGDVIPLRRQPRTKPSERDESVLDLSEPERCYHIITTLGLGELSIKERCTNLAIQDGKHGWLCETHSEEVRGSLSQLRFEAERQIIADILLTERLALKGAKRETVRLSPTQSITYLVR